PGAGRPLRPGRRPAAGRAVAGAAGRVGGTSLVDAVPLATPRRQFGAAAAAGRRRLRRRRRRRTASSRQRTARAAVPPRTPPGRRGPGVSGAGNRRGAFAALFGPSLPCILRRPRRAGTAGLGGRRSGGRASLPLPFPGRAAAGRRRRRLRNGKASPDGGRGPRTGRRRTVPPHREGRSGLVPREAALD